MYIPYTEYEAFIGDFQRITHALCNGNPANPQKDAIAECKENDIFILKHCLLNKSVWYCLINNKGYYLNWQELWNLHAVFDERIGIIMKYTRINFALKDGTIVSIDDIDPEELEECFQNRAFRVSSVEKSYRICIPYDMPTISEEETFKTIESSLYNCKFEDVIGKTKLSATFTLVEI